MCHQTDPTWLTRRRFIQRCAAGAGAATLARSRAGAAAVVANHRAPRPSAPSAWHKHGIILEPTESWEDGSIQNFTSPVEPLDKDRWRLWYSAGSGSRANGGFTLAYAEGEVGGVFRKTPAQIVPGRAPDAPLALGNLPEGWRPVQGVHLQLLSGKHRIYFWAHGHGIGRYLAADSEDGRRYHVVDPHRPVLYHPGDRAAHGVPSPDGVMLSKEKSKERPADEPLAIARLISNDATNVYQLPDGSFEMYSVALVAVPKGDPAYFAFDNAPGLLRVVDRYTSGDGLHFETRARVIQRDAKDPVDQQFYYLAVTPTATPTAEGRRSTGYVGMLGHYRLQAQTMDIEWCFSRDGLKWERPVRRAWLERGDPSQVDSYGIYGPHQLVQRGSSWHLFYSAVNSAHNEKHSYGPPRSAVMYATADSIWA